MTSYVLAFTPVLLSTYKTCEEELNVSLDTIHTFSKHKAHRNLLSFGLALNKNKKVNLNNDYVSLIERQLFTEYYIRYLNNCDLYIDSGGYQCGQGYINKEDIPQFCELYKEFLRRNKDRISYAFSLDIPPNDTIFNSWNEIEDINLTTYKMLSELSKDIRQKLIFVFHFRSDNIWRIWKHIATEYADKYSTYWSVGGIAGFNVNNTLPCWLYSLPLAYFLQTVSSSKLQFHILGDFTWTTILFSQLIPKLVKLVFNRDLLITYDATSIVTGNLKYRYIWKVDNNTGFVDKILLRKTVKHHMYKGKTYLTHALELLDEFALENNFPLLNKTDIDKEDSDSFDPHVSAYVILQTINAYYKVEQFCSNVSDYLVSLYKDNKIAEFNKTILEVLQNLHSGKLSWSLMKRKGYGYNTIQMMGKLNVASHYISMMQDEFKFKNKILTW